MSAKIFKIAKKKRWAESLEEKKSDPFAIKEGKYGFGQLKDSFYHTDWTEQSFLSDTSCKEVVSRTFDFSRLKYYVLFAVFTLLIIFTRAAWLQVIRGGYYYLLSEGNRLRSETIEAKRGVIYSRDMKPLVRNKANFVLYFLPVDLPKDELTRDDLIRKISCILEGQPPPPPTPEILAASSKELDLVKDNATFYRIKEFLAAIKIGSLESYRPLFVADNIAYDKAMLISLSLENWPGVFLTTKIRREYLLPTSATTSAVLGESSLAHILGYTGKINADELATLGPDYSLIDYVGKVGLEYSWEKELKGQAGQKNIEVDALGRQEKVINEVPALDGDNLVLSLDAALQAKAEEVLEAYISKANLKRAAVIVMNPNNGEILALVSLPSYNNNAFARGINQEEYDKFLNNPNQPLFNRAISGELPSGSTIKPIFAAGALQDKVITEKTTVLSTGGLQVSDWFFPDWKAGGHGLTDVKSALAWSINTFFYYIGGGYGDFKGLGVDGLDKYAELFGLGEKTGIDLPGEATGFVPTAAWKQAVKGESWYIGDTYHFAIGQGDVLVTPLQVANYTAAIANGGTLYVPHLVTEVLHSDNSLLYEVQPQVLRSDFIAPANLAIVRAGLRQTVTAGSAQSLQSLPVSVAGKTGTAQWSTKNSPHAWFTGFAPYENPQIVITVLVEEGVEGSTIAVLIARDILNWYFSQPEHRSS